MSTEVIAAPQRREATQVIDAVPIMDTARFEHFQRIANIMAHSSMIPETLRTTGTRDDKKALPFEQIMSNCFLVVNQATRWGMDPFSVISCCSVVHGRLAYEGKLVAAVLDAKLGVTLHHYFAGDSNTDAYRIYLSDKPFTQDVISQLKPGISIPGLNLWDGSVGEWKTTGAGTPWTPKNYRRMLIYRGTRDWARIYKPAIMLGVYTDDELMDLAEDARARRATPVGSLSERLAAAKATDTSQQEGFSQKHVVRAIDGEVEETSATDAHHHPDRAETTDDVQDGGNHEVSAQSSDNQSSNQDSVSDSSQVSFHSAADKPAPDSPPVPQSGAGTSPKDEGKTCAPTDADMLRAFSEHLFQIKDGGPNALKNPAKEWRYRHDRWPDATDKVNSQKINRIYAAHSNRVIGKLRDDDCRATVEKEIGS